MIIERPRTFIETLSNTQIVLLRNLFEFKIRKISWDFDEILSDTQTPVKKKFYQDTGFDFRNRKIDQWLALANWAVLDGANFDEMSTKESQIWSDPDVLMQAKPNLFMQAYSKMAYENGVGQLVITTRVPELTNVTVKWLEINYPWIDPEKIFIRSNKFMDGDIYKGNIACQHCSLLHFDDSTSSASEVLRQSNANLMIFPRALEIGKFRGNERVLEFSDMDLWFELFKLHKDVSFTIVDLCRNKH